MQVSLWRWYMLKPNDIVVIDAVTDMRWAIERKGQTAIVAGEESGGGSENGKWIYIRTLLDNEDYSVWVKDLKKISL